MRIVKIVQNFFLIIIRLKRIKKYDHNRIISRTKNKTIHVLRHANSKIKCNKRKNDNESSPPNDHECNKFLFKRNKSSSSNPIIHQLKDNESREDFKSGASGLLKNLIARNGMRVTVAWRIFNAPSYIVYLLVPWSQLEATVSITFLRAIYYARSKLFLSSFDRYSLCVKTTIASLTCVR